MNNKSNSFSKSMKNISKYRRRYGIVMAIRAWIHYIYRFSKRRFSNLSNPIIEVNGYKIEIDPNDPGISSELRIFKTHEPLTTNLTSKILEKGMTCLDIGSNIGYYAFLESNIVGKEGKVISIEPNPLNFKFLQKNLKLQKIQNIELYNFAAGNKNGKIRFLVYETSNECMTIPDGEEIKYPGDVIEVPSKMIDSFIEEKNYDKIDFLRMDVEGFENYIFAGMQKTLEKFKPLIQIEVHANIMGSEVTKNFLTMLANHGYEIMYFVPRDIDVPMIGTKKDIKKLSFNELISMVENDTNPHYFMLILKNFNQSQ